MSEIHSILIDLQWRNGHQITIREALELEKKAEELHSLAQRLAHGAKKYEWGQI